MAFGSMAPGGGIGGMGANILKTALAAQQPGVGGAPNPMAGGLIPMLAGGGGENGLIQRILKMGAPAGAAPLTPAVNPGSPPPVGSPAYVPGGAGPASPMLGPGGVMPPGPRLTADSSADDIWNSYKSVGGGRPVTPFGSMPPMGLLGKLGGGMQGLAGLFGGGAAGGAPGTW